MSKSLLFVFVIALGLTLGAAVNAFTNPSGNAGTGGGVIYYSGGNVGIGTAAPQAPLDIAGTQIQISDPSQNIANYSYIKTSAYTANTQKLTLGTTYGYNVPVDALTIFNGNVGIGVSPSYKLDVAGDINFTGTLRQSGTQYGGSGSTIVAGNVAAGAFGSNTGGGVYTFPGNVGIGTTGPGAELEISKPAGNTYATRAAWNSGDASLRLSDTYTAGATAVTKLVLNTSSGGYNNGAIIHVEGAGAYNAGQLVFSTGWDSSGNATERMRINSTGVGIGMSPNVALGVQGQILSNIAGSDQLLMNTSGPGYGMISNPSAGVWSLGYTSNIGTLGTSVLSWNTSGNVGIGTASPNEKLEIAGNTGSWLGYFHNAANGSEFDFAHGSGYGAYIGAGSNSSASTYAFDVVGSGGTYMYITGTGNVGIGTASPAYKMVVNGPSNDWTLDVNYGTGNQYGLLAEGSTRAGYFHGPVYTTGAITQNSGAYMYPGYVNVAGENTSYYIAGSTAWGLYTNTSFDIQGVYDQGNRVYSAANPPPTQSRYAFMTIYECPNEANGGWASCPGGWSQYTTYGPTGACNEYGGKDYTVCYQSF